VTFEPADPNPNQAWLQTALEQVTVGVRRELSHLKLSQLLPTSNQHALVAMEESVSHSPP
jgi:hypothetical protein